jgi:hypothetical protein
MSIEFVLAVLVISALVIFVICGILGTIYNSMWEKIWKHILSYNIVFTMFIAVWLCSAGLREWRDEEIKPIPVNMVNGVQFVIYKAGENQEPVIVNVNKYFNQTFKCGDIILLVKHQNGPYCGIYYNDHYVLRLPEFQMFNEYGLTPT